MVVQQHRRRGGTAVAAMASGAVAALVLATSGCSGDGALASDKPAGAAADEVRRAADVLADSGTARARTSMETAAGGTRVTIRGEGAYDFGRRMGHLKVMLPQDPAGVDERRPITELLAPGALYMKNRGAGVPADKWVRIDTTTLSDGNLVTGGATDPMAAAELLRGAREVTYIGQEKLSGTAVRHYRGVADIGRAAKLASGKSRAVLESAAKGFTTDTVPFEAYVDERGRLRKVRHQFSFAAQGAQGESGEPGVSAGAGGGAEVASTTLLYAFGTPVRVELPDGADIFAGKIAEG